MSKTVNMAGRYYGRLYVLRRSGSSRRGDAKWLCLCECGAIAVTSGTKLRLGRTNSCGCQRRDTASRLFLRHGLSASRTYKSWHSAMTRCTCRRNPAWKNYGGRGISVCERWSSFENFLSDMGLRPEGTSLDRIDVNGNYEPGNCRWATRNTQANNTRANRHIEHEGRRQTMSMWAREIGIPVSTLHLRLNGGWPIDRALTEKPRAKQAK
jgi:hypothetical protein